MNKLHGLAQENIELRRRVRELEKALRYTQADRDDARFQYRSTCESWQRIHDGDRQRIHRLEAHIKDYRETISRLSARLRGFVPIRLLVG